MCNLRNIGLVFIVLLSGCGGGGESSTSPVSIIPQPTRADYTITGSKFFIKEPLAGEYLRYDLSSSISSKDDGFIGDYTGILTTKFLSINSPSVIDFPPYQIETLNQVNTFELENLNYDEVYEIGYYKGTNESASQIFILKQYEANFGYSSCVSYLENNLCSTNLYLFGDLRENFSFNENSDLEVYKLRGGLGLENISRSHFIYGKEFIDTALGTFEVFKYERTYRNDNVSSAFESERVSFKKEILYIYPPLGIVAAEVYQEEGLGETYGTYSYSITNTNIRFN